MNKLAYIDLPQEIEEGETASSPSLEGGMSSLDIYCERLALGWWQEPLNTWSNLLFLLAALVALYLCRRDGLTQGKNKDTTRLTLCAELAAIGIASWGFHASGWALFAFLDVLAILVFIAHASFALLVRGLAYSSWQGVGGIALIFVAAPLFSLLPRIEETLQGGTFYLSPILALGLLALLIRMRARHRRSAALLRSATGLAAAFVVLAVSLTLRSLDLPLCADFRHGTHFLWHALNALALLGIIRFLPPSTAKP